MLIVINKFLVFKFYHGIRATLGLDFVHNSSRLGFCCSIDCGCVICTDRLFGISVYVRSAIPVVNRVILDPKPGFGFVLVRHLSQILVVVDTQIVVASAGNQFGLLFIYQD